MGNVNGNVHRVVDCNTDACHIIVVELVIHVTSSYSVKLFVVHKVVSNSDARVVADAISVNVVALSPVELKFSNARNHGKRTVVVRVYVATSTSIFIEHIYSLEHVVTSVTSCDKFTLNRVKQFDGVARSVKAL